MDPPCRGAFDDCDREPFECLGCDVGGEKCSPIGDAEAKYSADVVD